MIAPPFAERSEISVTPTEYRVARALAFDGAPNRVIAKRLYCTEDTIKTHVKNLLRKTGRRDRAAFAVAVWSGQIEITTTTTVPTPQKRYLLRELWTMHGHPAAIDASESA